MLLTSSQVSVAVSSSIVILCTSALFLSGYVIQQRTLRDLRRSLKEPPPTPPKIFLPDRFKKMTTELEDGTIVVLEDEDDDIAAGGRKVPIEVEIHASLPGAEDGRKQLQLLLAGVNKRGESQADGQGDSQGDGQGESQADSQGDSPASEAVDSGHQQEESAQELPETLEKPAKLEKVEKVEKPVSKAERRRLIKEEIKRLSHYDKPVLYQRRLY